MLQFDTIRVAYSFDAKDRNRTSLCEGHINYVTPSNNHSRYEYFGGFPPTQMLIQKLRSLSDLRLAALAFLCPRTFTVVVHVRRRWPNGQYEMLEQEHNVTNRKAGYRP